MTRASKQTEPKVTIIPTLCAFPLLDCSKKAFQHLRVRGDGYLSMLPINQQTMRPERFDTPKRSRK